MTGEFYFLLDGVSSLDMHIELTEEPPIQIPEERGETKTVLGLAGDLSSRREKASTTRISPCCMQVLRAWRPCRRRRSGSEETTS